MIPQEKIGADLHGDDADARKEAARMMGRSRSERKIEAARRVAESRRKENLTEEQVNKLRESQRLRREREQAAREASGVAVQTIEKKAVGRPRKAQADTVANDAPKRGRGRPPKAKAEQATLPLETPQEGVNPSLL